ncbi:MAG: hypothetical protein KJ607_11205 [Bacteroidetes bacterium]|nr:hypothetical protein [Bacteroidota bacterium]
MAKKQKSIHPDWATKHRTPGTELRLIRGNYYLYEYKTIYNKNRKRPQKISGKLIGTITQKNGLIHSEKRQLEKGIEQTVFRNIHCKEYGMSSLISTKLSVYSKALKCAFGDLWSQIIAVAYCRFVYKCPLKNIPFRLAQSYLPEMLEIRSFNEKTASSLLKEIGGRQEQMLSYMKSFIHK